MIDRFLKVTQTRCRKHTSRNYHKSKGQLRKIEKDRMDEEFLQSVSLLSSFLVCLFGKLRKGPELTKLRRNLDHSNISLRDPHASYMY